MTTDIHPDHRSDLQREADRLLAQGHGLDLDDGAVFFDEDGFFSDEEIADYTPPAHSGAYGGGGVTASIVDYQGAGDPLWAAPVATHMGKVLAGREG